MKTIYVDTQNRCHVADDGTMTAVQEVFFEDKCDAFIEGYCYEQGEGVTKIYPWKDYNILAAYQEQYEAMLPEMQDMRSALTELEVVPDE